MVYANQADTDFEKFKRAMRSKSQAKPKAKTASAGK
jgi:hypothetical protein